MIRKWFFEFQEAELAPFLVHHFKHFFELLYSFISDITIVFPLSFSFFEV